MYFHYMTYMTIPQHKDPCPGGHESNNLGRPFLGDHYYILSLSAIFMGVEKKIFKEIMYFHYMTYTTTSQHKNPSPGGYERYTFERPFLGHHCYILSLSDQCLGVEIKILLEIQQFYTFTPKITSPGMRGHDIYNFLSPYPTDATYQIVHNQIVKIGSVVHEKEMLTHDGRRTMDDGR